MKILLKNIILYLLLKLHRIPVQYDKSTKFLHTFGVFGILNKNNKIFIGKNTKVGCTCFLETDKAYIKIGDRCAIGAGTRLISAEGIEIGNDVIIAWDCYVYDHNSHSVYWNERSLDVYRSYNGMGKIWDGVKSGKIIIGDKVWIGFGAVILKGVKIGEGAVIGARSVVTKDVPPFTVVAGNPASVIYEIKR